MDPPDIAVVEVTEVIAVVVMISETAVGVLFVEALVALWGDISASFLQPGNVIIKTVKNAIRCIFGTFFIILCLKKIMM
jgi:hypothetical protein